MSSNVEENLSTIKAAPVKALTARQKEAAVKKFVMLLVTVIPVSCIFRCRPAGQTIRLIVVLDKFKYQVIDETKRILSFITLDHPEVEILYQTYGLLNDHLTRGHAFFSRECGSSQCIYLKAEAHQLPETSEELIEEAMLNTEAYLNMIFARINDFMETATELIKSNKLTLAAFMLHQSCEQLYRLVGLVFWGKEIRSHQLPDLRKTVSFYFPEVRQIFHEKERKELQYLALLQSSYLGFRYEDDFSVELNDVVYMRDKLVEWLGSNQLLSVQVITTS
ncbi:hypothetical protein [Pedobacter frigidisoli]|uniref:hypothetical protein n=1 Tax=Pedobacter frigidisoli TaxID=2530455 RepID=UPI00292DF4B6|nr:hypothetical protein [Pedobacter frigidisoli]